MLRRVYILALILATVAATLLYLRVYALTPGVPADDPVRATSAMADQLAPTWARSALDGVIVKVEERVGDVRMTFLIIFLLFYLQFYLRKRPRPKDERAAEQAARRRARAFSTQVKMFFVATLLVAAIFFGVELLARASSSVISILGIEIQRGDAVTFRRNAYHYGLLLAVGHLLAYMLITWVMLGFVARKSRIAQERAQKRNEALAARAPSDSSS